MMPFTDPTHNEDVIERFLLAEMEPDEHAAFEEQLFNDDALFFEVTDVENRLVDDYLAGRLNPETVARFDHSLDKTPGRPEKLANARSLLALIEEERPAARSVLARSSIRQRMVDIF